MTKKQQLGIVVAASVIVLIALVSLLSGSGSEGTTVQSKPISNEPTPLPPYPIPNGYALLLQAADHVKALPAPVEEMSRAHMEIFLSSHEEALGLLDEALGVESRVIVAGDDVSADSREQNIADLQRLADLVAIQWRWFEQVVKAKEAGHANLKLLQLGEGIANGGQVEDWTAGLAIQQRAIENAGSILTKLTPDNLIEFRTALSSIYDDALDRAELDSWARALKESGTGLSAVSSGDSASAWGNVELAQQEQLFALRLLFLRAGMRAYEFKHGQHPASLDALVPDFCSEIPINPQTNEAFTVAEVVAAAKPVESDESEESDKTD